MRLNSAFRGFFSNRLVMSAGTAIVIYAIITVVSSFKEHSDRHLRAKEVNLIIRQIGHRLLLQAGDSTSRVMPVSEKSEGTFLLSFENEFVFSHDSLQVLSNDLLPKTGFPSDYTVTVHDCTNGDIVYGFQLNNSSPDILACSGRSEPAGCYTIEFVFPDFYGEAEQEKAHIARRTKKVKIDASEKVGSKLAELKASSREEDVDQPTKSAKVDHQAPDPDPSDVKTTVFNYPFVNLVYGGMLLLGVALLIWRYKKNVRPVSVRHRNDAVTKKVVPDLPALGKFLFNVKDQNLLLGSEVIVLTDKECRVLELLHKNVGELIPREMLIQKIWIEEGVITGRSLDVFVSKLRKKLSPDPELRILNVHGRGYKLAIQKD